MGQGRERTPLSAQQDAHALSPDRELAYFVVPFVKRPRETKVFLIYRRTKNLRAVQLLLGHTKLESTVRYLGIEVDDALEMAEQTEV